MPLWIAQLVGAIFAIAGAVLAFIFLLPEKKAEKMNPTLRKIADFCNFKIFLSEYILKFLYLLCTIYCVVAGFFMLFSWETSGGSIFTFGIVSHAPAGIALMLVGPIVVRLVYELMLLFFKLANNVSQINKKLSAPGSKTEKNDAGSNE